MNSTVSTEVRDYVAQVRAALADLPVEDVEEFTTGMEADLAERLAEPGEGTLRDRLGEPDAYAAELRSAAGLPPRAASVQPKKPVGQRVSHWWGRSSGEILDSLPWLRDLRPVWWLVRGYSLAAIPGLMMGTGIVWLGAAGATVSIAAGLLARRGKVTGAWIGPLRVVVNLLAVLLLPFALALLVDGPSYDETSYAQPEASFSEGVSLSGNPVANLYAYDATGRRIDDVRLFDQNGQPVRVGTDAITSEPFDQTGAVNPQTGEVTADLGVFPLRWPGHEAWLRYNEWEPPMAITPLPGPVPSVEPSDPLTTPTPGASVSPSPSASPKGPPTSPSSGVSATPTPTPSPTASR